MRRQRLGDFGHDLRGESLLAHRPDEFIGDDAVAAHDEGFRHAVNAPVDADAARAIHADGGIGIAVLAEEAAGVLRLVLVGEADQLHAAFGQFGILRQPHQNGVLLMTGHAPGGEDVDERHLALLQIGVGKARTLHAVDGRQGEGGRRLADQGRGQLGRIAEEELAQEEQRQPREKGERGIGEPGALARRFCGGGGFVHVSPRGPRRRCALPAVRAAS